MLTNILHTCSEISCIIERELIQITMNFAVFPTLKVVNMNYSVVRPADDELPVRGWSK